MNETECAECQELKARIEDAEAERDAARERAVHLEETLDRVRIFLKEWEEFWAIPPSTERFFQKELHVALDGDKP
jgi:hypothetical protein